MTGGGDSSADSANPVASTTISTIIFDVDDTLYDVNTGFTAHRNTDGAVSFMVDKLAFPTREAAQALRDEYFERYHATAKGLQVAEAEGRLPPDAPKFDPKELSKYWAENLNFSLLGTKESYGDLQSMLQSLKVANPDVAFVAFSNGPRMYVLRALREMGLDVFFPDDNVYAVEDVLPHCKPEPAAFQKIFKELGGVSPEQCVMVEDSMKNIRVAKKLGMNTVLIAGKGRLSAGNTDKDAAAQAAEATKFGDAPDASDPAVDIVVEAVADMKDAIPGLWRNPSAFAIQ
mmetsp:Transcript_18836/g.41043  ORF Transcript_18836/g.41043 Transcript_18836/m.41043 type:complete len:288 (-) Transcript_18836:119-982(-)|eukprot:CAMPEP_0178500744 /NCGR_PEP_ID=MMETSP0696-20121128/16566_1 /TAXON_ID=265572 /ORGANISM="Extubocellulus spinifer, Strain CCMP396" /LENGTH=287 /DNA_ID=CAMNT_0020129619 /DNA_START=133 /DNA_END=996 /DNA_ORIENTATION=+